MQKIVNEARAMLRESGWSSISMRRLAARLDVKAPSLYKHISGKEELLQMLLAESLYSLGQRIHAAIDDEPTASALLNAYRQAVLDDPHGYRLMSRTKFVNMASPSTLDAWIREAFIKVAGEEAKGLAMWAFAHGLVTAELVQDGSPADEESSSETSAAQTIDPKKAEAVDGIWAAGAKAFD